MRRTKEEAQETRNRILDTAEQVFYEKGVSRTGLADIADAAGVTRGAIYWHFENKTDLFNAMVDRVALPLEEETHRADERALQDPLGSIRDCCVHVLRRTAEDPRARRVFEILIRKCEYVDDLAHSAQRQIECRARGQAVIERQLRAAQRLGQLPARLDVRRAAFGLLCYVDGLLYHWLLDPSAFALAREAERYVDQYLQGLRAEVTTRSPASKPRPKARRPALRSAA
jgi:TetR/AcrR family acrAB operon transcriptional repressor